MLSFFVVVLWGERASYIESFCRSFQRTGLFPGNGKGIAVTQKFMKDVTRLPNEDFGPLGMTSMLGKRNTGN
jgi:hypothetical protein